MAIFRNIQMSFWTDNKIIDDFTPEDRYFYLYLMTNPHTTLSGCYEVSIKQMSDETGYTRETIEKLIKRLETIHKVIVYSAETKEVLLTNWSKYNWTASEKFRKPLLAEIQKVKNGSFKGFLMDLYNGNDTVSIPYTYRIDTTVTDTVTDTDTDTDTVAVTDTDTVTVPEKETEKEPEHFQAICSAIGGFYNERCLTMPRVKTITPKRYDLLREGLKTYTLDDYKELFDKASKSKFLRGEKTADFQADFGWLIDPENMVKVLEGKYDDREEAQQKSKGAEELDDYYKMLENWAKKAEAERLKNEGKGEGET